MSRTRVVGIDGGATRSRVVLADASQGELGRSRGGPGIIGEGADDAVVAELTRQVRALATEAGEILPVDALCAGLAGAAGRPEARHRVVRALESSGLARTVVVVSDSLIAFADAFGTGPGILLIGGTGSIALGRDRDVGQEHGVDGMLDASLVRVGGWGRLLGDEGSAYRLGLAGLRAAVRCAEGRSPASSLTGRLFAELGAMGPQEAFEWSETAAKGRIAALAPHVVSVADDGDPEAGRLVARNVSELVDHAAALRERMGGRGADLKVALVGGLVEPGGSLHERVESELADRGFAWLDRALDPVRGAVGLAFRS